MIFNASLARRSGNWVWVKFLLRVFVLKVWEFKKITPIIKTGAQNEKHNYMPISLLSASAKLIKKIVPDRSFIKWPQVEFPTNYMVDTTCLGSLLFIQYLHDLEFCLKFSKANLDADDIEVSLLSNESYDAKLPS